MTDPAGPGAKSGATAGDRAGSSGLWRGWAAPALVFFTSGAVLVIEILAGRLVAPYVGVSLETYTGIIGTVLAGIAAGSAIGGRLADRHDPARLLGPLIVAGGATAVAALPVIAVIGPPIAAGGGGPVGIVTLAVTAFVLPTALLSAVTPMVAKLRLASTEQTGSVVGGLSAAGTAGALVGTFATGFVFLSALPTRPITFGVGCALAVCGVLVSLAVRRRPQPAVAVVLVAMTGAALLAGSPCEFESRYYCVAVVTDELRPSGRTLVLDDLRHSYVDLDDPSHLQFRYSQIFADVIDANLGDGPLRALHIGGGGFTLPRWLEAVRPGSTSVVLELDPEIVSLAESELGLVRGPRLVVRTGDARLNIATERAGAYDLVVGDAFGGVSVPWHLTTVEMLREIERTMTPDGMYILNMIDGGPRGLVRGQLAALRVVFDHVAVVVPPDGAYGNYVLAGADRPLEASAVAASDGRPLTGDDLDEFIGDAVVLRDDFAPADQLVSKR